MREPAFPEPPPATEGGAAALGDVFTSIEVSQIVIRACTVCGGPRTQEAPCESCGNLNPPITHDLGVVTGVYRDSVLRDLWSRVRKPAVERRISSANAQALLLRRDPSPDHPACAENQT
jgi:hypothetical protein